MNEKVDLRKQTILSAIPVIVTQIYAFHKINRTKHSIIMFGLLHGLPISWITYFIIYNRSLYGIDEFSNYVNFTLLGLMQFYGSFLYPPMTWVFIIFYSIIPIYFVRRWTRQYNSKLSTDE